MINKIHIYICINLDILRSNVLINQYDHFHKLINFFQFFIINKKFIYNYLLNFNISNAKYIIYISYIYHI